MCNVTVTHRGNAHDVIRHANQACKSNIHKYVRFMSEYQYCPWWRASAGSVGWFSLVTQRPLSSPPGPSWAWPCGSETRWWPARWRVPAAARFGHGRPEKGTSGTKTSSPARKSGGSWRPSATFSSSSTSASVRRRLDALDLGGVGVGNMWEGWNGRKGHFPQNYSSNRGHCKTGLTPVFNHGFVRPRENNRAFISLVVSDPHVADFN